MSQEKDTSKKTTTDAELLTRVSNPQLPTVEQLAAWQAYRKAHPELNLPGKSS